MNVVFILSDQHNAEFTGCYGGMTRTPHLDALAAGGARFNSAYSNSPLCTPSRASMFSGRYIHETGYWDNATPYDGAVPGWGHYFREKGVTFNIVGKVDFQPGMDHAIGNERNVKLRHNFDIYGFFRKQRPIRYSHLSSPWEVTPRESKEPKAREVAITEEAIRWLKEDRPADRPWVLDIHYQSPHPRWTPRKDFYDYYLKNLPEVLPEKYRQPLEALHPVDQARSEHTCGYMRPEEDIRKMHAGYHATIEEVDMEIGKVLNALEELGLREDTLIIYSSDHGEMARAHGAVSKISLYEDSARVPLIINEPGLPGGVVRDEPVSLIDIYPTVSEAVGIPSAIFARGNSLLDLAHGKEDPARPDFAFSESHANGCITGSFMIRHGDWKLIENVGYDPILFNLKEDPQEMNNLIAHDSADPVVQEKLYTLRRRLYSVCSPEASSARAFRDQDARRRELATTGRLQEEQVNRACKPHPERLDPDPELVKDKYDFDLPEAASAS